MRAKEDMIGKQKQQMLEDHFGIKGIRAIRHSTLWHVAHPQAVAIDERVMSDIIHSHILYNPYAHDCYYY